MPTESENDPVSTEEKLRRKHPASIAGIIMIVIALVLASVIGVLWLRSTEKATAQPPADETQTVGAETSPQECSEGKETVTLLAEARLRPVLDRAAAEACVELKLLEPGLLPAVGTRLREGEAAAWIADSSEQALSLGVPETSLSSVMQGPVVFSAPAPLVPLLSGGDWRDILVGSLPDGVRIEFPEGGLRSPVAGMVVTRAAEKILAENGNDTSKIGAAVGSLSTAASNTEAPSTVMISELAQLPKDTLAAPIGPLATLDYPMVRASGISKNDAESLDKLLAALTDLGEAGLAEYGYVLPNATKTTVSGVELPLLPHGAGDTYTAVSAVLDPELLTGSITVLLDVSGSMNERQDSGISGIEAVRNSVTALGETMPSGLYAEWRSFGVGIGERGSDDLLMGAGVVGETRGQIAGDAANIVALPVGTPLYQVVVDNYRRLRESESPGLVKLLVVVTDGQDQDAPGRLKREEALAALSEASAGQPPVPILFMGFGEADLPSMQEMSNITGGNAWKIERPEQLSAAIVEAVLEVGVKQLKASWGDAKPDA